MPNNVSTCRSCGAKIVWMKTRHGYNIPVNTEPGKETWLVNKDVFDPKQMITHFVTCPDSKKWRKEEVIKKYEHMGKP